MSSNITKEGINYVKKVKDKNLSELEERRELALVGMKRMIEKKKADRLQ